MSWWRPRKKMKHKFMSIVIIVALILATTAATEYSSTESVLVNSREFCLTEECIKEAFNLRSRMNTSIQPCDDFYEFVCGRFIQESVIPNDKTGIDAFNTIGDLIRTQVRTIINKPSLPNEKQPFILMKKMYHACMDIKSIEETGLETMKLYLTRLGGWPILQQEKWVEVDWINVTHKLRQYGFNTDQFFSIDVEANPKNTSELIISIDEGRNDEIDESNLKFGLEDDLVQIYAEYLTDLAVFFGANKVFATNEVNDVIKFRSKIAKFIGSKSEHYQLIIDANVSTVEELQLKYPTVSWLDLINGALMIENKTITQLDRVLVIVPKYIKKMAELITNTSKRVQVNHALFDIVTSYINILPKKIRQREREFLASATGATEDPQRWEACVSEATSYFHIAADHLYIDKYESNESKKDVTEMVSFIKNVFTNLLENVTWMDSETKEKAIEKAQMITSHVAFTPELQNQNNVEQYYEKLQCTSDNILDIISEVSKFKRDKVVNKYGKPVAKNHWSTRVASITTNAFYDPQENSVQIPAGIMQKEFYTKGRPKYMNYGGLGFVIGHEITHGFDSDGKRINKMGDVLNWWKKSTDEAFLSRAQCFIEQYSNFTVPEFEINLDGQNTLSENIADNGGAKAAYLAYLEWIKQNQRELPLPGLNFTDKQLFWIFLTNAWCTKSRLSSIAQSVISDEHSPERFRILGALSNLEYFAEDFKCPLGSNMNPMKKCQIW